ncbi:hypothetical protein A2U01_0052172, partial [Trifolium medium]|nr:hypothetical protein [Trifolium medium]
MLSCEEYAMMGSIENPIVFYTTDLGLGLRKAKEYFQYQGHVSSKMCIVVPFLPLAYLDEHVCIEVWCLSHMKDYLYFKQWDPGGHSLVQWKGWNWVPHRRVCLLSNNLEDK